MLRPVPYKSHINNNNNNDKANSHISVYQEIKDVDQEAKLSVRWINSEDLMYVQHDDYTQWHCIVHFKVDSEMRVLNILTMRTTK